MRGLPEDLTHNLSGLAGLLEDKVGSLAVFQLNPEGMQKMCLAHVLGDNSPLVIWKVLGWHVFYHSSRELCCLLGPHIGFVHPGRLHVAPAATYIHRKISPNSISLRGVYRRI